MLNKRRLISANENFRAPVPETFITNGADIIEKSSTEYGFVQPNVKITMTYTIANAGTTLCICVDSIVAKHARSMTNIRTMITGFIAFIRFILRTYCPLDPHNA
jgi:hypothetical protein